jgi:hypothetical protein
VCGVAIALPHYPQQKIADSRPLHAQGLEIKSALPDRWGVYGLLLAPVEHSVGKQNPHTTIFFQICCDAQYGD